MAERGLLMGVADEGGWWPAFASNDEALDALMLAIERAGLAPGDDVAISLDVAASEFGRNGRYRLGLEKREIDRDGLAELLLSGARAIRSCRSKTRSPRTTLPASSASWARSATASRSSATTCLVTNASRSPRRPARTAPMRC